LRPGQLNTRSTRSYTFLAYLNIVPVE